MATVGADMPGTGDAPARSDPRTSVRQGGGGTPLHPSELGAAGHPGLNGAAGGAASP